MGNAALLARAAGHEVLGADAGVYPPMSTVLADAGIALHEGYDPARLERLAPDLVVIGNALSRGNSEIEWLLDTRALPFVSLPAMLREFILKTRRNLVICGTHGKTALGTRKAKGVAVTRSFPARLGSRVFIPGMGAYRVDDRLPGRSPRRIDIRMRSHRKAKAFGRRWLLVTVRKRGFS